MKGAVLERGKAEEAISYREPMRITAINRYTNGDEFAACPRCNVSIERTYQSYCDRCGQKLDWKDLRHATVRK